MWSWRNNIKGVAALVGLLSQVLSQEVPPPCCTSADMLCVIQLGVTCTVPSVPPGDSALFVVDTSSLAAANCTNDSSLVVEAWDMRALASPADSDVPISDVLLFMAKGQQPVADWIAQQGAWTYVPSKASAVASPSSSTSPEVTYSDEASWYIQRPYHRVYAPFGDSTTQWHVTLLNVKLWQPTTLNGFQIEANCVPPDAQLPCPRASVAHQECNGQGTCGNGYIDGTTSDDNGRVSVCYCLNGFGGYSCTDRLYDITSMKANADGWFDPTAALLNGPLPPGEWLHMSVDTSKLPRDTAVLMVELLRSRGQEILFMKRNTEGYEPYALPSIMDLDKYADAVSFIEHRDQQFRYVELSPDDLARNTTFYVSVFNNPRLNEAALFSLRVRPVDSAAIIDPALSTPCPFQCSGHGTCTAGGSGSDFTLSCICDDGWAGELCDGDVVPMSVDAAASEGTLPPGGWRYFRLDFTSNPNAFPDGVVVELEGGDPGGSSNNGQAVLVASSGPLLPTVAASQWTLTSQKQSSYTKLKRLIDFSSVDTTVLTIGLTNLDFFYHSDLHYSLRVTSPSRSSFHISPWITVGAVLGGTTVLCACLCAYRAIRAMHFPSPVDVEHVQVARNRGCPASLINSLETFVFDPDKHSTLFNETSTPMSSFENAAANGGAKEDDGPPTCSVCLVEYGSGDTLRRLPCQHCFHKACIDEWLGHHTTCPICRTSLMSPHMSYTTAPSLATADTASVGDVSATTPIPARTASRRSDSVALTPNAASEARSETASSDMNNALSWTNPHDSVLGLTPVPEGERAAQLARFDSSSEHHLADAAAKSPAAESLGHGLLGSFEDGDKLLRCPSIISNLQQSSRALEPRDEGLELARREPGSAMGGDDDDDAGDKVVVTVHEGSSSDDGT